MNKDSPSRNSNSSFKTKTAEFSQNGFSEEIVKLSQKAGVPQYAGKNDNVVNEVADQTNCYGNEEPLIPPGFGRLSLEGSKVTPVPPGYEVIQQAELSSNQKVKAQKNQNGVLGKRITRSQTKKVEASTERMKPCSLPPFKGSREVSPQSNSSSKTTESMAKLALESLEVGELLGVKVIGKKEVALKRITSGLKKVRKRRNT